MPSLNPKQMLEEILKHAKLTPSEHEMFGDIWDKLHRYKRATRKQGLLIEKVYYEQKLDRGERPLQQQQKASAPLAKGGVATMTYRGVTSEKCVTNLAQFSLVCPDIKPGSAQHAKIAEFFRKGGQVLKVKPREP